MCWPIGLSACQGTFCESLFSLNFGEDELLGEVAKSFHGCDPVFFDLAPQGVEQAVFLGGATSFYRRLLYRPANALVETSVLVLSAACFRPEIS